MQEPPNRERILKSTRSALLICEKSESCFLAVFHYKSDSGCGVLAATIVVFRAPKGQLLLARGSAPGKRMGRESAPCKGSYITQHALFILRFLCSCPYRALEWWSVFLYPGRCIYDAKTGCTRHSPSKLGSALVCTVSVPGLYASHCSCAFGAPGSLFPFFNVSIFPFLNVARVKEKK